jgi:hypothetical protein
MGIAFLKDASSVHPLKAFCDLLHDEAHVRAPHSVRFRLAFNLRFCIGLMSLLVFYLFG